jgi:hypothetical protein
MGKFIIPDWATPQPVPPPPPLDPRVARAEKIANDTRVESELNRFIASKQEALFNNPDAFYRTQGEDAFDAARVATRNPEQLRDDLLDGLANDYQRRRLGAALDAQIQLTRDGMARHVAEQSLVWQRGVAQDRIALLTKEAAYHHNDTDLVDGLGHAAANAARAHARVGDTLPDTGEENAAAATARSGVLGAAIQARLDKGDTDGATAMFAQVKDQLDPGHAEALQSQMQQATAKPVTPPQPTVHWQDNTNKPPFEPNVIIPWELQLPRIRFDFQKAPSKPPPEDDRPAPPSGLPGEDIG